MSDNGETVSVIVVILLIIAFIETIIAIVTGIALFLFWSAVGILGIGIAFGGGVSIYNYVRSFLENVRLEKPTT